MSGGYRGENESHSPHGFMMFSAVDLTQTFTEFSQIKNVVLQ